jgi:hypothetical protein
MVRIALYPFGISVNLSPQRHAKIPLLSPFIKGEAFPLFALPLFRKEGGGEIYLFLATVRNDLSMGKTRATIVRAIKTPLIGLLKKMVQSFWKLIMVV